MDRLRKDGVAIMFVTHRLEEASAICDRMTVLRDGRLAGHLDREDGRRSRCRRSSRRWSAAPPPSSMRGRRERDVAGDVRLSVRGLRTVRDPGSAARHRARRRRPRPQGRRDPRRRRPRRLRPHRAGARHLRRRPHRRRHDHARRQADRAGIAGRRHRARHRAGAGGPQAPGDLCRARHPAQFLGRRARRASATASASWPSGASARRSPTTRRCCRSAWPRPSRRSKGCPAATSRRWCSPAGWRAIPKVLIVDEPTRGVDVGAKAEVHQILVQLAARGIAIMMISSELPEVLAVSDRIVTMRRGRITGEMPAIEANGGKADGADGARSGGRGEAQ